MSEGPEAVRWEQVSTRGRWNSVLPGPLRGCGLEWRWWLQAAVTMARTWPAPTVVVSAFPAELAAIVVPARAVETAGIEGRRFRRGSIGRT